jgi:hydrogenase nickel insertion protein HypA
MHEASLARAVVETVTMALEDRSIPLNAVAAISIRLGELAQVDEESLSMAYGFLIQDTELEGTELNFVRVPATLLCVNCATASDFSMERFYTCPACQGPCRIEHGLEFEVATIELAEMEKADERVCAD